MAIIIAIIAAVIVIAALITFNVRSASPGPEKQEATDRIAPPEEEKTKRNTLLKQGLPSIRHLLSKMILKKRNVTQWVMIFTGRRCKSLSILTKIRQKKRSLRKVTKCRTAAIVMRCSL